MSGVAVATPSPASAAADTRRRRALVAARLIHKAPQVAAVVDWETLERAPAWLALPDTELGRRECRIGALAQARSIRLWIDGPRLAAARVMLGEDFLARLQALPEMAVMPAGSLSLPRIDAAAQVGPLLQAAGASVLLATLEPGPLRQAAQALLSPAAAAEMHAGLAEALIARADALAQTAAVPERAMA